MAATPMMSILAAKAALDAITALVTNVAHLYIRTGALEATTLTADAGTLLATLTLNATPFGAATSATTNGLATSTAGAIASETNAPASGTAAHFRIKNNTSAAVILQGTVGTSAADLIVNTTTITAGDTVSCSSFKITLPCGDGVS